MSGSINAKIIQEIKIVRIANKKINKALIIVSLLITRLKAMKSFPLKIERLEPKAVNNVVVLIPPPVEHGDAPININKIVNRYALGVSRLWSKEQNPAVLVVTA